MRRWRVAPAGDGEVLEVDQRSTVPEIDLAALALASAAGQDWAALSPEEVARWQVIARMAIVLYRAWPAIDRGEV